ncbi:MAG: hypothetical protein EXR21_03695 [Flavobacteriaceae bacterium]|nr:hypothetical protein [Flavobacteriaceae bacterium]
MYSQIALNRKDVHCYVSLQNRNSKIVHPMKSQLLLTCLSLVQERIDSSSAAVKQAQESANSEEKSSAGDKYETGRAMSQNQRDMNQRQLLLAKADMVLLQQIAKDDKPHEIAGIGSCMEISIGTVFISVGLGVVMVGKQKVMVVSLASPLAKCLLGKKAGDMFEFNGKKDKVKKVY